MGKKSTYKELEQKVAMLEEECARYKRTEASKKEEEELQKKNDLYEQLFEGSKAAIAMTGRDSRILRINDAFSRLFGYTPDEVIGRNRDELIMPRRLQGASILVHDTKRNGCDFVCLRKDGTSVDVSIIVSPILLHNERIGTFTLYWDITQRKLAERSLQEAHVELEMRIKERTAELEKVNAELQEEIVERKRAAKELLESEERFRLALEATRDGLWENSIDHKRDFFSDRMFTMLGYEPMEPAEAFDFFCSLRHPDEIESWDEEYDKFNRPGCDDYTIEFRLKAKDGTWRSILSRGRCVKRDAEGRPVRILGTHTDITERKRAEGRLTAVYALGQRLVLSRDVNEIAHSVVDAAQQVLHIPICSLWLVDDERKVLVRWAQTTESEPFGLSPMDVEEERGIIPLVVRTGELIYIPDVSKESRYVGSGFLSSSELCIPLRVGDQIIGALNAESDRLDSFNPADRQLLEALANVAAIAIQNARLFRESQRRAEEMAALREVNLAILSTLERDQFLEVMFNQLNTVIGYDNAAIEIITPDGGQKIIVGEGSLIHDQSVWEEFCVKHARHLQKMKETRQSIVVQESLAGEHSERVGKGEEFSLAGAPLFGRDSFIGYLMVEKASPHFYDRKATQLLCDFAHAAAIALENVRLYEGVRQELTERERAEKMLKQYAAKLEWSNRELEGFAYIASHDLQEPLRKVQTFSDRLRARYGEVLGDQGLDYLERMQGATARMDSLIHDLLSYSRVTTQARPFVPVDLGQVVKDVVVDLDVRIQQVGARVEVGTLPSIDADPTQMRQLLQNLIGNALKFYRKDEPPVVKVYSKLLQVQEESSTQELSDHQSNTDDARCQVFVEDNGIGFDEKYTQKIFQAFQRLHSRSQYEGSGIGLAICQKIIERHRGSITVRSRPGQGATFVVALPVKQSKEKNEQ